MKIGFLFPGQGSQSTKMGQDLYEKHEEVRDVYDKVCKITSIDIKKITFEEPDEILNQTQNTQLAILTESLAILEILKKHNINAQISCKKRRNNAKLYTKRKLENGSNIRVRRQKSRRCLQTMQNTVLLFLQIITR